MQQTTTETEQAVPPYFFGIPQHEPERFGSIVWLGTPLMVLVLMLSFAYLGIRWQQHAGDNLLPEKGEVCVHSISYYDNETGINPAPTAWPDRCVHL